MEKRRVALVEDEAVIALHVKQMIQSLGFVVTGIAATGEDAISLVGRDLPDLVVMDIGLRGEMSGYQAAEEIISRYRIPVLFVSAYSSEEVRRGTGLGAPILVAKPVSRSSLEEAITAVLGEQPSSGQE